MSYFVFRGWPVLECTLLINDTTEFSFILGILPHEKRMMPLVANPERVLEFMIIRQYIYKFQRDIFTIKNRSITSVLIFEKKRLWIIRLFRCYLLVVVSLMDYELVYLVGLIVGRYIFFIEDIFNLVHFHWLLRLVWN
jgi:hypothetical protein